MDRITVFDGEFWVHKNFPPVKDDTVDEFVDCVKELAARLAAYEDTGLEPEEIRDSIGGISPICVQCDGKTSDGVVTEKCGYPDDITKCLEQSKHLCELAQAEKEGRLVVLRAVLGTLFLWELAGIKLQDMRKMFATVSTLAAMAFCR